MKNSAISTSRQSEFNAKYGNQTIIIKFFLLQFSDKSSNKDYDRNMNSKNYNKKAMGINYSEVLPNYLSL